MNEHKGVARGLVAFGITMFLALTVAAAGAQEGPYGSTTTTTGAARRATVELTVTSGPTGTDVGVNACGYEQGSTGGSVTFDGEELAANLIANAEGCLTGTGNAPPGTAPLTIRVPDSARPGNHNVCSALVGYNTPCARFRVDGNGNGNGNGNGQGAQVLGESVSREPSGSSGRSGSLPRTGAGIVLLLVLAALLLVVGRRALDASRRRLDKGA